MQDLNKNENVSPNIIPFDREKILAEIERYKAESMMSVYAEREAKRITDALDQIPLRFRDKTFADFIAKTPEQEKIKHAAERFCNTFDKRMLTACFLFFIGKCGTGKTLLALIIYQTLINNGYQVEYQPSIDFLRSMLEKQQESQSFLINKLEYYRTLPLLIIDEVTEGSGVQAMPADWERHMLKKVIDARYSAKRPTILISNRNNQDLIMSIGEPTFDRVVEEGAVFAFNWESQRRQGAKHAGFITI